MDWMNRPNPYNTGVGAPSAGIPDFVTIDDVPPPSATTVSLGVSGEGPVTVDLAEESPHILVNAPTGLGKSTVARSVGTQILSLGDLAVFLDVKMHSHRWARNLAPLAFYADTVPVIGASLINLGRELQRRNQVVRDWQGPVETAPVGPRVVVFFEETNATLAQLKELDRMVLPGDYRAMDAFRDLTFMGRAVKMHVIVFAQLASYRSGLTADILENFGTKVMIGYSDKAWKWLASDCGRYRVAPQGAGRGMVVHGGKATETQLVFMPEQSAADHVLSALPAQRRAREMSGGMRGLPPVWRAAIGR